MACHEATILLLPAGFPDSGNQTLVGHFPEIDTGNTKKAHVSFGTTGKLAAVM